MIGFFLEDFGLRRLLTHVALALVSAGACWAAHLYVPRAEAAFVFMLGFGYISLAFIALTLLIGPINLLRQRRNPVSINLRRDVGIWAGITGCLHIVFALQLHFQGRVWFYFFAPVDGGFRPLLNRFGIANWLGLAAAVILVLLLLTSNTLSLRRLKGKRWKQLQRLNYGLAVLVLLHTLLLQGNGQRQPIFMYVVLLMTLLVMVVQWWGMGLYRSRRR